MRVVLVGPYPHGSTPARGGVETSFANLLTGLKAHAAVEPYVVTFVPGLRAEERVDADGVSVRYLPVPRRLSNPTLHVRERRALSRVLAELEPDVVHAQEAQQYGYTALASRPSAPVLVSIHGIVREERRHLTSRGARARASIAGVAMERYCVRNARFLVAPTTYAQRVFAGEIRGRIWEVPNPIADDFFALRPAPEPGRILFTGALIPRKRLLDLVEALPTILEAMPGVQLRVTGSAGDMSYGELVMARVHALGLDGAVSFLGSVTFGQLLDEYRRAWVLGLPSAEETSPMVIAEAMAVGVPVVATRVGGVGSLVDDGVTGRLVHVGDVEALAALLLEVLRDPDTRATRSAAARARAEQRFRVAAVAERFAELYAEIASSARMRHY